MSRGGKGGPYRIAAMAELTGVPEPTLRAWERRYGVPSPPRTDSGYRLYGDEQLRQVAAMRRLCDGGMSAAEAAKRVLAGGIASSPQKAPSPVAAPSREKEAPADAASASVRAILGAVERLDDRALDEELRRAMFLGAPDAIFERIVAPVMIEVGERWHVGAMGVAEEHLATQKLTTLLRDLLRLSDGAGGAGVAVLGCFADDAHEIGLLGCALRFARWGIRPIFLGARTPPSAIRRAVAAISPSLVALSVSIAPERARARALVGDYAAACGAVPWIVGGSGSTRIADLVASAGGTIAPSDATALRALVGPTEGR